MSAEMPAVEWFEGSRDELADLFAVAGVVALFVLPSAASFLPKLRLAPRVAIH